MANLNPLLQSRILTSMEKSTNGDFPHFVLAQCSMKPQSADSLHFRSNVELSVSMVYREHFYDFVSIEGTSREEKRLFFPISFTSIITANPVQRARLSHLLDTSTRTKRVQIVGRCIWSFGRRSRSISSTFPRSIDWFVSALERPRTIVISSMRWTNSTRTSFFNCFFIGQMLRRFRITGLSEIHVWVKMKREDETFWSSSRPGQRENLAIR